MSQSIQQLKRSSESWLSRVCQDSIANLLSTSQEEEGTVAEGTDGTGLQTLQEENKPAE